MRSSRVGRWRPWSWFDLTPGIERGIFTNRISKSSPGHPRGLHSRRTIHNEDPAVPLTLRRRPEAAPAVYDAIAGAVAIGNTRWSLNLGRPREFEGADSWTSSARADRLFRVLFRRAGCGATLCDQRTGWIGCPSARPARKLRLISLLLCRLPRRAVANFSDHASSLRNRIRGLPQHHVQQDEEDDERQDEVRALQPDEVSDLTADPLELIHGLSHVSPEPMPPASRR